MARRTSKSARRGSAKRQATGFVLDCSVALCWFFADETDAYADSVAASLGSTGAIVPALWHFEVNNVLIVSERRNRCSESQSTAFLTRLATLPIDIEQVASRNANGLLAVARQHGLSAYDAACLELAMRSSLPLATLDKKLLAACESVGVPRYQPST